MSDSENEKIGKDRTKVILTHQKVSEVATWLTQRQTVTLPTSSSAEHDQDSQVSTRSETAKCLLKIYCVSLTVLGALCTLSHISLYVKPVRELYFMITNLQREKHRFTEDDSPMLRQ